MSPLLVEFLGVVLRWLLSTAGAYLVAHHVLSTDQEVRFADGAVRYVMDHAAIWAPVLLSLLWGLWAKYKARLRFIAALELPAGASEDQARRLAHTTPIKSQAFTAVGILVAALFITTPAAAQTPPIDDCPAGHELHRSLTALDHQSMLAAYTASFVGLFHRPPTLQPGSGSDDGEYWVGVSNHYGLYGDDICRAGWNLYRERQLGGLQTGPRDGDLPAQFLPTVPASVSTPPPIASSPATTPVVCQAVDLTPVVSQLTGLNAQVTACNQGIASVNQNVSDGRKENQQFESDVKNAWQAFFEPVVKYILPAIGGLIAGHQLAK